MGKCEPVAEFSFLAGKVWFSIGTAGGGSEVWVAFWSAEWSPGVLVEVVLGMDGHCDPRGLEGLGVGKYRVHVVHGIMEGGPRALGSMVFGYKFNT